MTITFDCQERSKLSAEVAQVSALLEAGSPVRSYFLRPEAMPIYTKILPDMQTDMLLMLIHRFFEFLETDFVLLYRLHLSRYSCLAAILTGEPRTTEKLWRACQDAGKVMLASWEMQMTRLHVQDLQECGVFVQVKHLFFCDIASRRSLQTNELQSCKRQSEWIVGSCWDMLGHSEMMSRPVSIGTGVCEIIGGSVQTVFAAGGTSILLDPFAIELRFQVHKSVNHDQPSRPNLHLDICTILYHPVFYHVLWVNDKRIFKWAFRLQVLVEIVLGCLGLFGNSLEMAVIRALLKRFKENSLNFCGLWGKQDLTQGPRRTVSSTGASVDIFLTACSLQ